MHPALLTLVLMAGTSANSGLDPAPSPPSHGSVTNQATAATSGGCANCGNCGEDDEKGGCCLCNLFGMGKNDDHYCSWSDMPQSCYNPAYGCYPGNDRRINRYPAFYGTYYRKPYNYRNTFDYPWHAGLHEPTSLFSYNVSNPEDTSVPSAPRTSAAPKKTSSPK